MIRLIPFDYAVIAAYFAFMIGVGIFFARRQKEGRDYFAGGRRIPWWVAGVSLYMANFSAFMYTGNAAFTYQTGLYAILYMAAMPLSYVVGALLTASLWRRTRSVSPVEFTRTRFNTTTQQTVAAIITVLFLLTTGTQLFAVCNLIAPALGMDITGVVVGVGVIAVAYTMCGGLWAVTVCEFAQFLVLTCVTLAVVPLVLLEVGGVGEFLNRLPPLRLSGDHGNMHYDLWYILGNTTMFAFGAAQGGGQFFYSVRDEKSARRVGFLAGGLFLLNPVLFGVAPLAARMLWPDPSAIPVEAGTVEPRNQVFMLVCSRVLPAGTMGFFLSAALSATMDNLSVTSNMVSSLITRDVCPLLVRRPLSGRAEVRIGRVASATVGFVVIGMGLLAMHLEARKMPLFNQMVTYISLLGPPMSVPLVLGLRMRRLPRWGAVAGIFWGLVLGLPTQFFLGWDVGPRILLVLGGTLALCLLSPRLAGWGRSRPAALWLAGALAGGIAMAAFAGIRFRGADAISPWVSAACAALLGASVVAFGALFARETPEERRPVEEFFDRLATPVDVEREVSATA